MLRRIVADKYDFELQQFTISTLVLKTSVHTILFVFEEYSSILAVESGLTGIRTGDDR
jgi:hypothetical protein